MKPIEKPNPRDFAFNYVVHWVHNGKESRAASLAATFPAAQRLVRSKFPAAVFQREFEDVHRYGLYPVMLVVASPRHWPELTVAIEDCDDEREDELVCAYIERRRDAYENGLDLWHDEEAIRKLADEEEELPCPYCGEPLRTPNAKQCFACGSDWHDPNKVVSHPVTLPLESNDHDDDWNEDDWNEDEFDRD